MKIKVFFATVIILISVFFLLSVQKEKVAEIQMTTIEGNNISTNNLLGKVYLINFWATDCPGCIKEMPDLIKTYNKYKDNNFEILAISMHYDPPSRVMSYAQKNSLPFPVIMDIKKDIIKHFKKVKLTPTSILVNHEGKIVNTIIKNNKIDKMKDAELTIPRVIKPKNITNSKELFTGFLNLTIDKAPIIPRERAISFFIIDVIIKDIHGNKIYDPR